MNQEVLLYFRTVADEDNDDNNGAQTSVCFPASKLRAMNPTGDSTLTLYFDSLRNHQGDADQANEVTVSDEVDLTITANTHEAVMKALVIAINGKKSNPKASGILVVADDVITNVAGTTVAATYVNSNILSCGTIDVKAAHTGS
tara:strand:- start:477 stop:908 length:432 start_codon:yes stop_codon:yes gene_type:complete